MLKILEHVELKSFFTFKMGGAARYFAEISTLDDLKHAAQFAHDQGVPLQVVGGGSNIVCTDQSPINALVVRMNIGGVQMLAEDATSAEVRVGAGESWDEFVHFTCMQKLSGVEALAAIPGTVGGSPVQNIGAYGQEAKDTIKTVHVFDVATNELRDMPATACEFAYRTSIFKRMPNLIIVGVTFRLSKNPPMIPKYPGVAETLPAQPTALQIYTAITAIRNQKLPNPKETPNVGSFFHNPIVSTELVTALSAQFPAIKTFPTDSPTTTKISAAWLIENAGLKGYATHNFAISQKHALVITHNGHGTIAELQSLIHHVQKEIATRYAGITLTPEPIFIR